MLLQEACGGKPIRDDKNFDKALLLAFRQQGSRKWDSKSTLIFGTGAS
jgi:hypothetical protein